MKFKHVAIGDLVDLSRGYNPPKSEFINEPREGYVRFIQIRDAKNDKNAVYVPESKKLRKAENDDILLVAYRHVGNAFRGMSGAINVALCRLRNKDEAKLLNDYLFYMIPTDYIKGELLRHSERSLIPSMSVKHLAEIKIPLPPLETQKQIVAKLDQAFTDIEKAKVNAKQNLKNAKELFDSYLDSFSQEKKALGDFVEIKTGKLNSNAAKENGKYPFFTCSREIFAIDEYAFDCESILLAGNNASGDFNVKHYNGKFNAYQRTYVITIKDLQMLNYGFLYYQMVKSLRELKSSSVGAGTKFLKLGMIKDLKISIPDIYVQNKALSKLSQLEKNVKSLEVVYQEKINALDELKQSILQKAFNGELA